MESPSKRPRLSFTPNEQDPANDPELEEARSRNDQRLKSIFEGIFSKYEKDFTEVGDEIDLNTGDIVVNNGHISELRRDETGEKGWWLFSGEGKDNQTSAGSSDEDDDLLGDGTVANLPAYNEGKGGAAHTAMHSNGKPSVSSFFTRDTPLGEATKKANNHVQDADDSDASSADSLLDTAVSVEEDLLDVGNDSQHVTDGKRITNSTAAERRLSLNTASRNSQHATDARKNTDNTTTKGKPSISEKWINKQPNRQNIHETVNSIWRVPEISKDFSTPAPRKPRGNQAHVPPRTVRSVSPPETDSIWTFPPEPTRSNTDVVKKRKKDFETPPKEKRMDKMRPMRRNWDFAQYADEDESDDPLQEYQPFPTPKKPVQHREKSTEPAGEGLAISYLDCRMSFSHQEYLTHLKSVLSSADLDDYHDLEGAREQLAAINGTVSDDDDNKKSTKPIPETSNFARGFVFNGTVSNDDDNNKSTKPIPETSNSAQDFDFNGTVSNDDDNKKSTKPIPETSNFAQEFVYDSDYEQAKTKMTKTRERLTPDQARLFIDLKVVQGKAWKDIVPFFPERNLHHLANWNKTHWNARLAKPPPLLKPWSQSDKDKLNSLKDKKGLSWRTIRTQFPGRSYAEIEFKFLRLWVRYGPWPSSTSNRVSDGATFSEHGADLAIEGTGKPKPTFQRRRSAKGQFIAKHKSEKGPTSQRRRSANGRFIAEPRSEKGQSTSAAAPVSDNSVLANGHDQVSDSHSLLPSNAEEDRSPSKSQARHDEKFDAENMMPLLRVEVTTNDEQPACSDDIDI